MARRRIWRNKPEAERERRRELEKQKVGRFEGKKVGSETKVPDVKPDPKTDPRYRMLSPMMQDIVDGLVARGLDFETALRGAS